MRGGRTTHSIMKRCGSLSFLLILLFPFCRAPQVQVSSLLAEQVAFVTPRSPANQQLLRLPSHGGCLPFALTSLKPRMVPVLACWQAPSSTATTL